MIYFAKRWLPSKTFRRISGWVAWLTKADDPPHRLALGIAIGIFCALLPLVGLQTVLVIALAWALRANKAIGLPLVWLTNPATFVPVFYPCYRVGAWLLGTTPVDAQWWQRLAEPPAGESMYAFYWQSLYEISAPLMLGSVLVAAAASLLAYWGSRQAILRLRAAKARHVARRTARRRARRLRPQIAGGRISAQRASL